MVGRDGLPSSPLPFSLLLIFYIPTLQMRKLRLREVKCLIHSHTVRHVGVCVCAGI